MVQRLDYATVSPESYKALLALNSYVDSLEIETALKSLVKIRVSQINGCLFCIDMHATEARSAGESEQRLDSLIVWSEASFFSDRERAALEWAESVTLCAETGVPDEVYLRALQVFSDKELVDLTCLVINMNGFNRIGISFRMEPPARTQ